MSFPSNYPNSPPTVKFTSELWHPNGWFLFFLSLVSCLYHLFDIFRLSIDLVSCSFEVYPDGRICISILHPPADDPNGYELASERWAPVHTVRISSEFLSFARPAATMGYSALPSV